MADSSPIEPQAPMAPHDPVPLDPGALFSLPVGWTEGPGGMPTQVGRYRILRILGKGGMGTVYEAKHVDIERSVALKLLRGGNGDFEARQRFHKEANILSYLRHPGIAQILDVGFDDSDGSSRPFFVMEHVRGVMAITLYARNKGLTIKQKVQLMAQVCQAIEYAHAQGVVHRDLKPGNILIDQEGWPKVVDFGVARIIRQGALEAEHTRAGMVIGTMHTGEGVMLGTLAYMSPEQATGKACAADPRADVYSLGLILHELLTNQPPPTNQRLPLDEIIRMITQVDATRLSLLDRHLRGDLETIVVRALEKDPVRRYPSAGAMAADLQRFLEGQPIGARPPSLAYRIGKFVRRNKALTIGTLAVVAALVLGIVTTTREAIRANAQARRADAQARETQARYAQSLVSQGDALVAADHPDRAKPVYAEAERLLRAQGLPASSAQYGMWNALHLEAEPVNFLVGHTQMISGMAVSPDGLECLTASYDNTVRLWDLPSGRTLGVVPHIKNPCAVRFLDKNRCLIGTADGELLLCRPRIGEIVHSYRLQSRRELQFELSQDHHYVYMVKGGSGIIVLDVERWVENRVLAEPAGQVVALAMSPDGRMLATGGADGTVCLWEPASGRLVSRCLGQTRAITAVAFSPGGQTLAASARDDLVRLWNVSTAQPAGVVPVQSARSLAFFSPNEILLLGLDGTAEVWGTDGTCVQRLAKQAGDNCVVTGDGGRIGLMGGQDGIARAYGLVDSMAPELITPQAVVQAALFPGGNQVASVSQEGQVCVWDMTQRRSVASLQVPKASSYCLAVSPDGKIITIADGESLTQWHPLIADPPWTLPTPGRQYTFVAYGLQGQLLAGVREEAHGKEAQHAALLWEAGNERRDPLRIELKHPATCGAFSPDGRILALGMQAEEVTLWNASGKALHALAIGGDACSVSFSHDGQTVVAGDLAGKVRIWEASSGRLLHTLSGHTQGVSGVAFAPDDGTVLSVGEDGILHVWDTASGLDHATMRTGSTIFGLSAQSSTFLTTGESSLRLWNFMWANQRSEMEPRVARARVSLGVDSTDTAAITTLNEWYAFHGLESWTGKMATPPQSSHVAELPR